MKGTTYRRKRYHLGTVSGGRAYQFTGVGEFRTEIAARAYIREHARDFEAGPVYVYRTRECWAGGVNYGITEEGPLPDEQQKQQLPLTTAQQGVGTTA